MKTIIYFKYNKSDYELHEQIIYNYIFYESIMIRFTRDEIYFAPSFIYFILFLKGGSIMRKIVLRLNEVLNILFSKKVSILTTTKSCCSSTQAFHSYQIESACLDIS